MAGSKRKKEVKQKRSSQRKIIAQGGDPERFSGYAFFTAPFFKVRIVCRLPESSMSRATPT